VDEIQDLPLGYHVLRYPVVGVPHIHELDEPEPEPVLPRELDQGEDVVVVDAALDHGIDLDRIEAQEPGGQQPLQDAGQVVAPGQGTEFRGTQGVEARVDPAEARAEQPRRVLLQVRGVGRQGKVPEPSQAGKGGNQGIQPVPQQGLPPGEPDLLDPRLQKQPGQARDLLEGEDLPPVDPLILLERHAVHAPEVAPVGDRYPQVPQFTTESVLDADPIDIHWFQLRSDSGRSLPPSHDSTGGLSVSHLGRLKATGSGKGALRPSPGRAG
jgi:hypothetical protein